MTGQKIWTEEMVLSLLGHINSNKGRNGSWMANRKAALALATADINARFQVELSQKQVDTKVSDLCKKHLRRDPEQDTRELLITERHAIRESYLQSLMEKQPSTNKSVAPRPAKRPIETVDIPSDGSE